MVGFDDGASISFTSWVIAPTYPRKMVQLLDHKRSTEIFREQQYIPKKCQSDILHDY